jgi:uncharacterized LabA/DUF88 family protein
MDILYTGKVDGFCIVSSDSDFTRLATRLREAGMKVIGIGEKKTLNPFITACDKFIYIEILKPAAEPQKETSNKGISKNTTKSSKEPLSRVDPEIVKLLTYSVDDLEDENGWTSLAELGSLVQKKKPDFDSRNYGHPKMLSLIKSIGKFEIEERETGRKNVKHIYIRKK